MFFVYIDSTDDGRPFYVGKGNAKRLRCRMRNDVHTRIANKHGWHREIVLATSVENITLAHEVELIAQLRTQCNIVGHWGANLTSGGEGVLNSSPDVRLKMSQSQKQRATRGEQSKHTEVSKERIRQAVLKAHAEKRGAMHGRKHSPETIEKMRQAHTGKRHSEATKQKVGEASRARWATNEFREKAIKLRHGTNDSHR